MSQTRLQLDSRNRYNGLIHCARTIYAEEGAAALYKGLSPFIMHLTLKYALRFGTFGYIKNLMGGSSDGQSEAMKNFTAGLAAGLLEAMLIVTPFEVVKTRLQKQEGLQNLKYRGPVHVVTTMVREEGPGSLWKGVIPTMIRQGSNQAFNFMTFAFIQRHLFNRVEGESSHQQAWQPFVNGLLASVVGPMLNCPMDVVKTRLMAQETKKGVEMKYKGFIHATRLIAKEEGVAALWKGLVPRLLRLAPGQAITWTVVTTIQSFFLRLQEAKEATKWESK
jgi:solute carrier family 25 citrate transporter 1